MLNLMGKQIFTFLRWNFLFKVLKDNDFFAFEFSDGVLIMLINGPRREKTCLRLFRKGHAQTRLLSYRDHLENLNFA